MTAGCFAFPSYVKPVWERLTVYPDISAFVTVTLQTAVFPPSVVLAVIFAVPSPTAVTFPAESTLATDALLLDQATDLSRASEGLTAADSCFVSPIFREAVAGLTLTPVTFFVEKLRATFTLSVPIVPVRLPLCTPL